MVPLQNASFAVCGRSRHLPRPRECFVSSWNRDLGGLQGFPTKERHKPIYHKNSMRLRRFPIDGACPSLELPANILYSSTVCLTVVLVICISHRRVHQSWSTTFDCFTAGVAILSPLSLIRFLFEDGTQYIRSPVSRPTGAITRLLGACIVALSALDYPMHVLHPVGLGIVQYSSVCMKHNINIPWDFLCCNIMRCTYCPIGLSTGVMLSWEACKGPISRIHEYLYRDVG